MGCRSSKAGGAYKPNADASTSGSSNTASVVPTAGSEAQGPTLASKSSAQFRTNAACAVRCTERTFDGQDKRPPVKLIVFDLDETITLATFMPKGHDFKEGQTEVLRMYNFMSPFVVSDRLEKLKAMLRELSAGVDGKPVTLAVLSRNQAGVRPVLQLLMLGGLEQFFSCIWVMPWDAELFNGAYFLNGDWEYFNPPLNDLNDHKADVLDQIAANTVKWFPQLTAKGAVKEKFQHLLCLELPEIMLVDDQRANFKSNTGKVILRCCKVARYEAEYRNAGLIKDMGGIGAHNIEDFDTLVRFSRAPWDFPETYKASCQQRLPQKDGAANLELRNLPVSLVVFDFDETLTLATFLPPDEDCFRQIGWKPSSEAEGAWTERDLVMYNFETPWVENGNRVDKLKSMLARMASAERQLVILTKNEKGAVAVLNLLLMAGLTDVIDAIWSMPWKDEYPNGVHKVGGEWTSFDPPMKGKNSKVEVLQDIVDAPARWLPRQETANPAWRFEGLVLIDDERRNFQDSDRISGDCKMVLRTCKVARYDKEFRDCQTLNQMGGIGAHSDSDYDLLVHFVLHPAQYYDQDELCQERVSLVSGEDDLLPDLQRSPVSEPELVKQTRERRLRTWARRPYQSTAF